MTSNDSKTQVESGLTVSSNGPSHVQLDTALTLSDTDLAKGVYLAISDGGKELARARVVAVLGDQVIVQPSFPFCPSRAGVEYSWALARTVVQS